MCYQRSGCVGVLCKGQCYHKSGCVGCFAARVNVLPQEWLCWCVVQQGSMCYHKSGCVGVLCSKGQCVTTRVVVLVCCAARVNVLPQEWLCWCVVQQGSMCYHKCGCVLCKGQCVTARVVVLVCCARASVLPQEWLCYARLVFIVVSVAVLPQDTHLGQGVQICCTALSLERRLLVCVKCQDQGGQQT